MLLYIVISKPILGQVFVCSLLCIHSPENTLYMHDCALAAGGFGIQGPTTHKRVVYINIINLRLPGVEEVNYIYKPTYIYI